MKIKDWEKTMTWDKWLQKNAGERMDANLKMFPQDRRVVHLARYNLVRQILDEICAQDVVSLPSGTGYGEDILSAESTRKVLGCEVDGGAVQYATETYGSKNCSFRHVDGRHAQPDIHSKDCVVCLEGIEHVKEEEAHRFLENFWMWTKPHGRLIISFPHNWGSNVHRGGFHLWNPTWDGMQGMLRKHGFVVDKCWIQNSAGQIKQTHRPNDCINPCAIFLCSKYLWYSGETAYVFGKGPSYDRFEHNKANDHVKVFCNHAGKRFNGKHRRSYVFCPDVIEQLPDIVFDCATICCSDHNLDAVRQHTHNWIKFTRDLHYGYPPVENTMNLAVSWILGQGVKKLVFVGCDYESSDVYEYAPSFWDTCGKTAKPSNKDGAAKRWWKELKEVILPRYDVEVEWFHRGLK